MPNKWFEKFVPSKESALKNTPCIGGLRNYISHPDLWHVNHESVARGAAVGLFVAVIPVMPFQTLLTIIFAILLRANLPVSIAFCWANNPLTFVPIIYIPYYIGNLILGTKETSTDQLNIHFNNFGELWSNLSYLFVHFGKAYFVGLPFFAIGIGLLGYFIIKLLWYLSLLFKQLRK